MLRYCLADHRVPAMCANLAAARLRGVPVGEGPDDARSPADLAHQAPEGVVGANASPVLLREGVGSGPIN